MIPSWVDWDQIQRGIDLFITFLPSIGMMLFYGSLVPGFSIPKIAKVLFQTKYLAPPSTYQQVFERLKNTGAFPNTLMLEFSENTNKEKIPAYLLQPGNPGWTISLQVRALHAKVCYVILNQKKQNASNEKTWNTNLNDSPINQEDLTGTILAFSVNVILGIEFISGKVLSKHKQLDYLALWRYIGWLLGIETDTSWLKSPSNLLPIEKDKHSLTPLDPCGPSARNGDDPLVHAYGSLESIIWYLMMPDESSVIVARHLLSLSRNKKLLDTKRKRKDDDVPEKETIRISASSPFMLIFCAIMCQRFISNELADALYLPHIDKTNFSIKTLLAYLLATLILVLMRIYTLLTMNNPWV